MGFKVDLHIHTATTSPCGEVEPEEIIALYTEAGYDGLVITDHFYKDYFENLGDIPWSRKIDCFLAGYRSAKAAAKGLKVFMGIEYRNIESDNDFLVLGLTQEFLYEHQESYLLPLEEAIDLFHSIGAIVIQAHPIRMRLAVMEEGVVRKNFRTEYMVQFLKENPDTRRMDYIEGSRKIENGETEAFKEPVFMRVCDLCCPKLLDGIEVYNGNYNWMQDDQEMQSIIDQYPHLIKVSSSDFHEPGHCARGGIILANQVVTSEDLVRELKQKNIFQLVRGIKKSSSGALEL